MAKDKNPLEFVSQLFELAIWPFQAASNWQATYFRDEQRQLVLVLLFPALILVLPLSLLISVVAMTYVFFVLPFILAYQGITALVSSTRDK